MVAKTGSKEWRVAEAKNKFSELLDRAECEGPQHIRRHGKLYTLALVPSPSKGESEPNELAQYIIEHLNLDGVKIGRQRDFCSSADVEAGSRTW